MKRLKIFTIVMSLQLTICCQEKKHDNKILNKGFENFKKSKYFSEDRIKADKYKVKYYGDVSAFGELSVYYSYNKSKKEEFLPYILLMVEKHKNYRYFTIAFDSFLEFFSGRNIDYDGTEKSLIRYLKNLEKINSAQKEYLLYFVRLGAANNNIESINLLELLNREGVGMEKNLFKADSLKNVSKNFNKNQRKL